MRFKFGQRLLFLAIGSGLFLGMYSAGAAEKLTPQEAAEVRDQFSNQIKKIDEFGIFVNNMQITLGMFIPGAGVAIGSLSGYMTGNVFSAIAQNTPALKNVPPQIILATPFGAMELFAYGLAMSRSGLLVYQMVRKKPWRQYALATGIELGIAAAVLVAGAMVEWWMIQQYGGLNLEPGI